jgi:hypothetical protein
MMKCSIGVVCCVRPVPLLKFHTEQPRNNQIGITPFSALQLGLEFNKGYNGPNPCSHPF